MTASVLRPLVLCGPSGSGKSTLMKKLMNEFDGKFGFSVSHTTRVTIRNLTHSAVEKKSYVAVKTLHCFFCGGAQNYSGRTAVYNDRFAMPQLLDRSA